MSPLHIFALSDVMFVPFGRVVVALALCGITILIAFRGQRQPD
jgi:hypothetical protein